MSSIANFCIVPPDQWESVYLEIDVEMIGCIFDIRYLISIF
nr:MAG TPA: hypothetical protein [Caudoviricetes sp.]